MVNRITHWINGKSWSGKSDKTGEVFNPATGLKTGEVDFANVATIDEAIESAYKAFPNWRDTSLTKRAQIIFKFRELLNDKIYSYKQAKFFKGYCRAWTYFFIKSIIINKNCSANCGLHNSFALEGENNDLLKRAQAQSLIHLY